MNDQPDRLLIVDDDPELLKLLSDTLRQAGHAFTPAADGQLALLHPRQRPFELVLLDSTLPDLEGVEVLRRMRRTALNTPVLMLTARDSLEERIAALDAGPDDYLTKPFELQELNARVRAQLRRRRYEADTRRPADLTLGDLNIDLFSRSVRRGEREVNLSQREFELLCFLVREPESVHSRQAILEGFGAALLWATPTPWMCTWAICAARSKNRGSRSCCTPSVELVSWRGTATEATDRQRIRIGIQANSPAKGVGDG